MRALAGLLLLLLALTGAGPLPVHRAAPQGRLTLRVYEGPSCADFVERRQAEELAVRIGKAQARCRLLGVRAAPNVITNAMLAYWVDAWQGAATLSSLRYHGLGTGSNAPFATDLALQTELTSQYTPANTRATGTLGEGASANIFRTVGTTTMAGSATLREWGLFSQAATGGGTMGSRVTFTAQSVIAGNVVETDYAITFSSQ